jgi:hypothetical protein
MKGDVGRFLAAVLLSLTACVQDAETARSETEASSAVTSTGYELRLDSQRSDPAEFRVSEEAEGLRVQTGPAGVAWRGEDESPTGSFTVRATFVQYGAPVGYREAYGVFVGGRDLLGPGVEYTYLLVRSTGDFLIKRRLGEDTETLVDWTAHPAVQRVEQEGDAPRNTLSVEVVGSETRFMVNGAEVHRMPTTEARPDGVAGIRANHRLDILVSDWTMGSEAAGTS